MQRALVNLIRHTDIRLVYGIMHLWLVWYIVVRTAPRNGIYRFHRRRGRSRFQAAVDVYRSFCSFGKAVLDRFAVYAGCSYKMIVENRELYYDRVESPKGFIMLFSHLGNTEMAGYFLSTPEKQMHILVYGGESAVVTDNRANAMARNNIGIILERPDDMSHIYRINEVLQQGGILAFAADRRTGDTTLACSFMGTVAQFPAGPFRTCVATGQPVLLIFVIKEDTRTYRVCCEQLDVNTLLPKREQAHDLACRYAQRLETMALKHPYQWFNMYDFWA